MKKCSECGAEAYDHVKFCTQCGSNFYIQCPNCGRELDKTALFCSACGANCHQTNDDYKDASLAEKIIGGAGEVLLTLWLKKL